jgi:hypothetical protein
MKEPEEVKLTQAEGEALIERINVSDLVEEDRRVLSRLIHMYFWLMFVLQEAKLSMKRLRALLFGRSNPADTKSEPTEPVDASQESEADQSQEPEAGQSQELEADTPREPEEEAEPPSGEEVERDAAGRRKRGGGKPQGQGRYGAEAYTGAERVLCQLEWEVGQLCPACERGTLYRLPSGVEIRLDGQGFLTALHYELEKLRCSACGQVFTAPLPEEAGAEKYSDRARAVLALGRYYLGVPFYRLEKYQRLVGVPVADATQWDQVERLAGCVWPVFNELVYQAAQADRLHEDDTSVRVLSLIQENARHEAGERRGMYTTGLVAMAGEHEIWLYFNGRANAGENAGVVVQLREAERGGLILMSDALSANELEPPSPSEVIKCFCLAHGGRKFSEIEEAFPQPCRYVLQILEAVFAHERATGERRGLSDEERLAYHQRHSAPLMQTLRDWLQEQVENRDVEPNSSLGKALNYLRNHWTELTQFLRVPGAPLDNNAAERALKLMIRQRRNSLFFASAYSAGVASMLCSVIATAMNAGVNVVEYLVVLQQHGREVMENAHPWLPWNYQTNLIPP